MLKKRGLGQTYSRLFRERRIFRRLDAAGPVQGEGWGDNDLNAGASIRPDASDRSARR